MRINQWLNAVRHWLTCNPLSTASIDRVQHRRAIRQPGSRGCNLSQALESRTLLTSLVVSTDSDVDDGNYESDELSLREAIVLANADPDPSTITFAPTLGFLSLQNGQLPAITEDLDITGAGARELKIGGDTESRIFEIDGHNTEVSISGVEIGFGTSSSGGGGCILLQTGTLHIAESLIRSCNGDSGGAIRSGLGSVLTIEGSTFAGNRASLSGGAIQASGELHIHNSTFALNSAGIGGAIALNNAEATAVNSTFFRNWADDLGGGFSGTGNSKLNLQNSILAANFSYAGTESYEISLFDSATVEGEHNLIGETAGTGGLIDGIDGNIVGAEWTSIVRTEETIPVLLYNNSQVPTTALLPGSPAIDAGDNALALDVVGTALANDQRGLPRILNGNHDGVAVVDIGAVEAAQNTPEQLEVNSLSDVADGNHSDGELSLREAIMIANERPGEDTITFADSLLNDTIVLSGSELPPIVEDIVITGPGAEKLSIDGANTSPIFSIPSGSFRGLEDANATISGLTLRNGLYESSIVGEGGGAIRIAGGGTLTVSGSELIDNTAENSGGAIYGSYRSTVVVNQSKLSKNTASNGGAIFGAAVQILQSVISYNDASSGGGVSILGRPDYVSVIANSLIHGNEAIGGAGIEANHAHVVVNNTTVHDNSATTRGGGIRNLQGTVQVINSTVASNKAETGGGGLANSINSTSFVHNSIFAGNEGVTAPDIEGPSDSDRSLEVLNSLISDTSGTSLTAINGNLLDIDWKTVLENDGTNPILTDNGGPTASVALLPNSPAIDAGNNALAVDADGNLLTTDQRGASRIQDGNADLIMTVDIGAVEATELPIGVFQVDNASDISDGDYSDGELSLREAITLANDQPGVDQITFDAALNGSTILLSGAQLPTITEALKLTGPGKDLLTIDGAGSSRILEAIGENTNLEVSHLTLQNGNASTGGGGGAIRVEGGSIFANESRFSKNYSAVGGGAIDLVAAEGSTSERFVIVTSSIVSENTADTDGGGIRSARGIEVQDSTITDNEAPAGGGLAAVEVVEIVGSTLSGNKAFDGGGVASNTGVIVTNSTINGNIAEDDGGAVAANEFVTVINSEISNNSAGDAGGGIFSFSGPVAITDSTVSENTGNEGGGVWTGGIERPLTLTNSSLIGNSATQNGGGILGMGLAALNSTIAGNTAGGNGGGVVADGDNVRLINSTIVGNTASGTTGGVLQLADDLQRGQEFVVHNSIIAGNTDVGTAPDFQPADNTGNILTVLNSLIGDTKGTMLMTGNNNLLDIDWTTVIENDGTTPTITDNGGTTPTIALLQGSPAIDAGDNALAVDTEGNPLTTDQRAFPRLLDGDSNGTETVDIGAVEFEDTIAPTLMITPDGTVTSDEPVLFTFQFDEDVTGFETRDVSVVNGNRGNIFAVNGSTYTMDVFPGADGNVTVAVAAGAAVDAAGNESRAASATVSSDTTTPTVSITPDGISTSEAPITFSFEFSEGVSFALDDIALTNGTAETLTALDDRTYTLEVTPTADNEVTVSIADDTVMDSAGNSVKAESATVQFDATRPTVSITPHDITTTEDPILFTFEFSEEVTGFHQNDINITNGRGETFTRVDDSTYTLQVVPRSAGNVTVSIAADSLKDEFGHTNVESSATVESRITSLLSVSFYKSTIEEDGSTQVNIQRLSYLEEPLTVSLSVSDTTRVSLAPEVEFRPRQKHAHTFLSTPSGNKIVDGDHTITITAKAEFYDPAQAELTLVDDDSPELALLIKAASIIEDEGAAAATAVVSRNTPTELPLVVSLVSSDLTEATVPATVTIPAGASSAEFHIDAVDDVEVDLNQPVTIEASATGLASAASTFRVVDNESSDLPRVLAPSGPVSTSRPEFVWKSVPNAVSYRVWVEETGGDANPVLDTNVITTRYVPDIDLGNGVFRVWVRANFADGSQSNWTPSVFRIHTEIVIDNLPFHGTNRRPTITWPAQRGFNVYRVYIENLTTNTVAVDEFVAGSSFTPEDNFDFGKHRIWVRGIGERNFQGDWSRGVDYYIGPAQIDPIKSTSDTTPTFEWESMANVASVQLYVSQGRNVIVNESGLTTTSFTVSSALEDNLYRWWIRPTHTNGSVGEWSPMGRLEIGERPIVFAPEFNTSDSTIQVAWGDIAGAGSYEIYLYNDDTSSLVDRTTGITGSTYDYHPLPDGNYRVWIRSYTGDGQPDKWSRPHRFVIDAATVDLTVTLISPLGSTFDTTLDFDWAADADAERYDLYVAHGDTTFEGTNLGISSYQYRNPVSTDRVSWWVRARNSAGEAGPWVKGEVDISARPQTIAMPGPITEPRPTIQWQPVAGAERYTVYISGPGDFVIREQVTETEFASQVDFQPGEHRIWIQAISSGGLRGPWSTVYTVQVDLAANNPAEETDDAFEIVDPLEAVPVVQLQTKQSPQQTPRTKPQPDRDVEVPVSQNRRKNRTTADSEIGWELFDEMNWLQKI